MGDTLAPGVIVVLALVNLVGPRLVERSEGVLNLVKLAILAVFIVAGLASPSLTLAPLGPAHWVGPGSVVAVGMLVFLSYEGFELIANASGRIAASGRTLPIAYYGSVLRRSCSTCSWWWSRWAICRRPRSPAAKATPWPPPPETFMGGAVSRFWPSVPWSPQPRRSTPTCSVPPNCR